MRESIITAFLIAAALPHIAGTEEEICSTPFKTRFYIPTTVSKKGRSLERFNPVLP